MLYIHTNIQRDVGYTPIQEGECWFSYCGGIGFLQAAPGLAVLQRCPVLFCAKLWRRVVVRLLLLPRTKHTQASKLDAGSERARTILKGKGSSQTGHGKWPVGVKKDI